MRKKLLEAPPEAGAIQTYTSELSRRLHHALPGERADEIVREAEAHLHDQADAIAATCETKVPRQEAEARAVAAFTPPVAFARDMARSAVETRFSKAWYATGKVITAFLLFGMVAGVVFDGTFNLHTARGQGGSAVSGLCFLLFGPTTCLCAFLARRAQTRHLLRSFALAALFLFIYTGFFYTMVSGRTKSNEYSLSRLHVQENDNGWREERMQLNYDIQRLQAGLQTYRQKNPTVPALLHGPHGRGYLVPYAIKTNTVLAHTGLKNAGLYFPFSPLGLPRYRNETVSTAAEARARWLTDGPEYLAQAHYEKEKVRRYAEPLRLARQQAGFSAKTGWWWASDTFPGILYPLILDWLFAKMGRVAYVKRRARRERRASHA